MTSRSTVEDSGPPLPPHVLYILEPEDHRGGGSCGVEAPTFSTASNQFTTICNGSKHRARTKFLLRQRRRPQPSDRHSEQLEHEAAPNSTNTLEGDRTEDLDVL